MAEDTIIVDIDDSALEETLMKLQLIGVLGQETTGSPDLGKSLPIINRNLRIIMSQAPGMRQAIQAYFRLGWIESGILKSPLRTRLGFAPLPVMSYGPLILTLIATAFIVLEQVQRYFRNMQMQQQRYEAYLMRERGWTRDELKDNYSRIHNYTRSFPG